MRRTAVLLLSVLVAVGAGDLVPRACAQEEEAVEEPVRNISEWDLPKKGERLAIRGYDPVAYFPEGGGKATKGDASVAATHGGVVYRFASARHREMFLANPARYEPAHGGWCSWAMIDGEKTAPDPESFIVKDDRLFLFFDGLFADTRRKWLKTVHETSAARADAAWLKISGERERAEPLKEGADG